MQYQKKDKMIKTKKNCQNRIYLNYNLIKYNQLFFIEKGNANEISSFKISLGNTVHITVYIPHINIVKNVFQI